jgi:hypothetical protein
MPDGQTIRQTQPFHVCGKGGTVTSQYRFPDENIGIGAGIAGAHGASGMSSLGGTVRVGELVPGGVIRHALKVNLFGRLNYCFDGREATPGYRWPAKSADGYAGDSKSACADGGRECQWAKDMAEVFTALHVVDDNAPGRVGGGGIGRQAPAPPVGN